MVPKNERVNIRPFQQDLRTLDRILELSPQSRSEAVRKAIALLHRFVHHPFAMVYRDPNRRLPEVHDLDVVPSPASMEDRAPGASLLQIRKDVELANQLRDLIQDRRAGSDQTSVIRTALHFTLQVLAWAASGWEFIEGPERNYSDINVLQEVGLSLKRHHAGTERLSTKPIERDRVNTKLTVPRISG